jgi:hypothetical protein
MENEWNRAEGDYALPADVVDYCRGLVRHYLPLGGDMLTVEGWWQHRTEDATRFDIVDVEHGQQGQTSGHRDTNGVVRIGKLAAQIAQRAHQEAVAVRITEQDGSWRFLLVNAAGLDTITGDDVYGSFEHTAV